MDALIAKAELDLPKSIVQAEVDRMVEGARADLKQRGVKDADNTPIPAEIFAPQAEKRVRLGLVVGNNHGHDVARDLRFAESEVGRLADLLTIGRALLGLALRDLRADPGHRRGRGLERVPEDVRPRRAHHAELHRHTILAERHVRPDVGAAGRRRRIVAPAASVSTVSSGRRPPCWRYTYLSRLHLPPSVLAVFCV